VAAGLAGAEAAPAAAQGPAASSPPPLPLPALDKVLFARLRNGALHAETAETGGDAESTGAVRGFAVCRCSIEVLWEVLTDHAQFPKFVPRVVAMQVSRRTGSGERALQTIDATLSTLRYALDYAWDPATRRIDFRLAEDAPHDLRAVRGHWQLWPLDGGRQVLVEYQSAVDVGRAVPGFIRGYLADRGVKDTLDAVRRRAEGLAPQSQ
jgi:ribosome-associated toxin RatA of RatAB toxin-antitoxin module